MLIRFPNVSLFAWKCSFHGAFPLFFFLLLFCPFYSRIGNYTLSHPSFKCFFFLFIVFFIACILSAFVLFLKAVFLKYFNDTDFSNSLISSLFAPICLLYFLVGFGWWMLGCQNISSCPTQLHSFYWLGTSFLIGVGTPFLFFSILGLWLVPLKALARSGLVYSILHIERVLYWLANTSNSFLSIIY